MLLKSAPAKQRQLHQRYQYAGSGYTFYTESNQQKIEHSTKAAHNLIPQKIPNVET